MIFCCREYTEIIDMRVLVTGASGLLGRRVFNKLKESKKFELTGTCYSRTGNDDLVKMDSTDEGAVRQWFIENKVYLLLPQLTTLLFKLETCSRY